jgi:hypothetical protein
MTNEGATPAAMKRGRKDSALSITISTRTGLGLTPGN